MVNKRELGGAAALVLVVLLACKSPEQRSRDRLERAAAAAASPTATVESKPRICAITIPHMPGATVPDFPTADELSAWGRASAGGDNDLARAALIRNRGVLVAAGTKCKIVDYGLMHTKVLVLEGPHAAAEVWLPTEWTKGE